MAAGRKRAHEEPLVIGWVEWASLPDLGVASLKAKVDTGARTSALHVLGMMKVGEAPPHAAGAEPRVIVELKIPSATRGKRPKVATALATVIEFVNVRDSGGHAERRPVIETLLVVGSLQARVRVTLTDRGDMLHPMLIGRTALGSRMLIDPHHTFRLTGSRR